MRADAINLAALARMAAILGEGADRFIVSAHDWSAVQRLVAAVPGLHAGFDPLAFYPRSLDLDANGFREVATRALLTAPDASIFYLEAKLIVAALAHGVDLVQIVKGAGAEVDAWTVDADHPQLEQLLRTLIAHGCDQVTSNDPIQLAESIARLDAA